MKIKTAITEIIALNQALALMNGQSVSSIAALGAGISKGFQGAAAAIGLSAGALGGFIAVAAGLTAIVGIINAVNASYAEATEKASQAASAYSDVKTSLEEQITKIQELRTQLDSGTLTEMEAYDAKQELLSIQQQLSESYGEQAAGIDLLNGKLDEQISKVQALTQADAEQFLNENRKGISKAEKEMTSNIGSGILSDSFYMGQYYKNGSEEQKVIEDAIKKYKEYFEVVDSGDGITQQVYLKANAEDAKEVLNGFMTDLDKAEKDIGESDVLSYFLESASIGLTEANEILDTYQEIYRQAQDARLKIDEEVYSYDGQEGTAAKWLNDYAEAVQKYNDSIVSGEGFNEAKNNLKAMDLTVAALLENDGFSQYADTFEEVREQANEAGASALEFTEAVSGESTDEASKSVHEYAEALKELGMTDTQFKDAFFFDTNNIKDGTESVKGLVEAAQDMGLISSDATEDEISNLASNFVSAGVLIADSSSLTEASVTENFKAISESANTVISSIQAVQSALSSQASGQSISLDDFNADGMEDYQSALEYVNGTMQLNAEKVREIAKAKAEEQIETNNTNKALAQAKYLENARQIAEYRQQLEAANFAGGETKEAIQASIDALLSENSAIADTCTQYNLLSASIQEAVGSYQNWLNAQSASDYGDMATDAVSAIQQIRDTYDQNSDIYGNFGSKKFEAAIDFIIPDSVDGEDLSAVESYMADFKKYLKFDDDGAVEGLDIDKFLEKSVEAGLMSYSDDDGFKVLGGKKMEDFAEGLNMSSGMVQAFFDELQLKGAEFDWSDEAVKTIGDLAVEANEAAEALRGLEGNEDLSIKMDVSDLATTEEQLSALDATIAEMDGVKAKFGVDSSEAEQANAVIQYCLTQKQLLSQPDVMRVDTSQVEGDIGNAISLLQEFQNAQNDLEIKSKIGADTSDAEAKISSLTTEIQGLSPDIKANLSLDTTSTESIKTSIAGLSAETINVKANVDASAITGYNPESKSCDVIYNPKTDALPTSFDAINRTVNYTANTSELPSSFSTITRYVNYVKTGDVQVNGTAHAGGTARAGGDWGTAPGGKTLVGELGREIVVDPRTGQWYTVGDNGAEFRDIPPGAIVFNHRQTESLLANGYVAGRASALVSGTAMVRGGYKPYTPSSSSTSRTPTSSSSSSSRSSSSSSRSRSSSKSSSSKKSSSKDEKETIDWIEIAIDRIERAIDRLKTTAENAFKTLKTRLAATNSEISKSTEELSLQQKAYNQYIKEANSVNLSSSLKKKVRNGTININDYSDKTAEKIKEYKEWYEKALDCKDAILELKESIAELYQNKFDDVASQFDHEISLIEHLTNTYNNGLDLLVAKGYFASTKYYGALKKAEQSNKNKLNQELTSLIDAYSAAMNSGAIKKYSEAWYEMQEEINATKEAIQECDIQIAKLEKSIQELNWEIFDYIEDRISQISSEADFLVSLMSNSDLFTDKGQLTDTGMATMGLYGVNYNTYMAQADQYAREIEKLNKEIAADPYDTDLIARREELLQLQQESILAAEDEKQAIVDLVEEGIQIELDALKELIDAYTDSLDSAKDLYEYQKKVAEQTAEIASIEKQLSAYKNDTSEEAKAAIQKLQVELSEAQEDLEETEYDQYISDQKKMLDDLYDEYETILNQRLDDIDALISDMIDAVNMNSSSIEQTISDQASAVGYMITDGMKAIWSNEGGANSIITKYGESFLTQMTTVNDVISKIAIKIGAMVSESDKKAKTTVKDTTTTTKTDPTVKLKTKPTTDKKPTNTTQSKYNDSVKQGVAAAIWIYGGSKSGWGNDPQRKQRLTAKFGSANAAAIQNYINAHGSNGDLYRYWVNSGKSKLTQYYYSAFKQGGLADYTGMAWLDGTPTKPEMVLNPDDTENFIALKDAMVSVANGNSPLAALFSGGDFNGMVNDLVPQRNVSDIASQLSSIISGANGVGGTSIGEINYEVNIPIDHVDDYDDFVYKMQHSQKFEQMVQDMTVNRMFGKSRLAKYR